MELREFAHLQPMLSNHFEDIEHLIRFMNLVITPKTISSTDSEIHAFLYLFTTELLKDRLNLFYDQQGEVICNTKEYAMCTPREKAFIHLAFQLYFGSSAQLCKEAAWNVAKIYSCFNHNDQDIANHALAIRFCKLH